LARSRGSLASQRANRIDPHGAQRAAPLEMSLLRRSDVMLALMLSTSILGRKLTEHFAPRSLKDKSKRATGGPSVRSAA
jgi:hypothetical protein